ncbi:MAG: aminoacyl-tRNA hydrolase [Acidimicrobiia bacterium]|nr:aminoacyl-tRNA hydrolase [Acidimicrobiia bacterium]
MGLRNPGASYDGTRHNIGAVAAEEFLRDHDASLKRARQGIRAEIAEVNLDGVRTVVALPTTFMNESGQSVAPLVRYYGIELDRVLVVHDDIDVPFAKLKVQWSRGHGGNNGVRSTIGSLGTNDFWRLKIGVGRPPARMDPADFVLKRFASSEREEIHASVYRASDVIGRFITDGGEVARQFAGEQNS